MEIKKNNSLLARKHFLLRAIENKNVSIAEGEIELEKLNEEIKANLKEALTKENKILIDELKDAKKELMDGDLKRGAGRAIIKLLKNYFSDQEIKGISRQMYKIMRGRE